MIYNFGRVDATDFDRFSYNIKVKNKSYLVSVLIIDKYNDELLFIFYLDRHTRLGIVRYYVPHRKEDEWRYTIIDKCDTNEPVNFEKLVKKFFKETLASKYFFNNFGKCALPNLKNEEVYFSRDDIVICKVTSRRYLKAKIVDCECSLVRGLMPGYFCMFVNKSIFFVPKRSIFATGCKI